MSEYNQLSSVFCDFTSAKLMSQTMTHKRAGFSLFIALFVLMVAVTTGASLIVAGPASQNYELTDYAFGSGGTTDASSNDYQVFGISGQVETGLSASTGYQVGSGLVYSVMVNLPPAPTFTNQFNDYNRLHLVIDTGGNPPDTLFAVAVSTDNFVSDTRYLQSDATIAIDLGSEDWKTYSGWGGVLGMDIIGLSRDTTYFVKVAALSGNFTEYRFGPVATATTLSPSLDFDIDVAVTDDDTDPPFSIDFGDLYIGTITDSPKRVWVDFTTNGTSGGNVYVYGQNSGLTSVTRAYTISSVSADLSAASEGFGAQGITASQTLGGPLTIASPYDTSGNNVGITDTNIRQIFSATSPVIGGRASFLLKAKSSYQTPIADDYSEILTVIAAGSY